MQNLSVSDNLFTNKLSLASVSVKVKTWLIVLTFAAAGFSASAFYGYLSGFPVATVQDELSYVVAADTYAHGRLTNPTPAFFEHFETTHVIMEPSYISKYPPLQGMFMAVGQVVFGHQIFGVWLTCGLFAASLFWMLSVWTKREWAILGTISMMLLLGINSYWAQSFWGGMIAASGGALFLGGFRQILRKLSAGAAVLMVLGGVILVNSRPFEGVVTMLPALFFLLVWFFRDKENSFSDKLKRLVLPGAAVAVIALSAMGYQYYRVTGSPFKMPYSVHHAQYYPAPLFSFQDYNPNATKGNPRIRRIYDTYTHPPVLDAMLTTGLPDSTVLRSIYGFIYLFSATPFFLLSPLLLPLFYISLPLVVKGDRNFYLIAATVVFTFTCMAFGVWWDQHHYAAPLTACFFLVLTEGFRKFYESGKNSQRRLILLTFILLAAGGFVYQQFFSYRPPRLEADFSTERALIGDGLAGNTKIKIKLPERATFFKDEFEKIVEKNAERYLAIVEYDPKFNIHDEIVYNKADIANAKLIWAHDLGEEKNRALINYYSNRKVLRVKLTSSEIEIEPLAAIEIEPFRNRKN